MNLTPAIGRQPTFKLEWPRADTESMNAECISVPNASSFVVPETSSAIVQLWRGDSSFLLFDCLVGFAVVWKRWLAEHFYLMLRAILQSNQLFDVTATCIWPIVVDWSNGRQDFFFFESPDGTMYKQLPHRSEHPISPLWSLSISFMRVWKVKTVLLTHSWRTRTRPCR